MPAVQLEPHRSWLGGVAAFGVRRIVRIAEWRAGREAHRAIKPSDQVFRGFVQINLIRLAR